MNFAEARRGRSTAAASGFSGHAVLSFLAVSSYDEPGYELIVRAGGVEKPPKAARSPNTRNAKGSLRIVRMTAAAWTADSLPPHAARAARSARPRPLAGERAIFEANGGAPTRRGFLAHRMGPPLS